MKNKFYYPVIFNIAEEGGYWMQFPDLDGCFSEGDTLEEAVRMASEAIGVYLEDIDTADYPKPSDPADIKHDANSFVMLVEFDKAAYDRKYNSKAVKKTLTIPAWLNKEALKRNINFSNVLQNALIHELNLA